MLSVPIELLWLFGRVFKFYIYVFQNKLQKHQRVLNGYSFFQLTNRLKENKIWNGLPKSNCAWPICYRKIERFYWLVYMRDDFCRCKLCRICVFLSMNIFRGLRQLLHLNIKFFNLMYVNTKVCMSKIDSKESL